MQGNGKTHYPFVWYDRRGWWFRAAAECFGPYKHYRDAWNNLAFLQELNKQLHYEIETRSVLS